MACLHPDDREAATAAFAAAADPASRAIYDVEYRTIFREDGVVHLVAPKGIRTHAIGRALAICRYEPPASRFRMASPPPHEPPGRSEAERAWSALKTKRFGSRAP
jgi:hypothetical protein